MSETIQLKISGLHCTSCAMNIDGDLEDAEGVFSAQTSYAKSQTLVEYDPQKISQEKIREIIKKAGYEAEN